MRLDRRTAGTSGLTARAPEQSGVEMDGRPLARGTEPGLQAISPDSFPCSIRARVPQNLSPHPRHGTPLTGARGGGKMHLSGSEWGKVG